MSVCGAILSPARRLIVGEMILCLKLTEWKLAFPWRRFP
jgi:hypothetical protein